MYLKLIRQKTTSTYLEREIEFSLLEIQASIYFQKPRGRIDREELAVFPW